MGWRRVGAKFESAQTHREQANTHRTEQKRQEQTHVSNRECVWCWWCLFLVCCCALSAGLRRQQGDIAHPRMRGATRMSCVHMY